MVFLFFRAVSFVVEVSLYLVQVVLGYLLMLTVMTYNVYVSISILLGVALGYIFFGHKMIEKRLKNIQRNTMPCQHCVQSEGECPYKRSGMNLFFTFEVMKLLLCKYTEYLYS